MNIKAIIFDYGNVLSIPQTQEDINKMVELLNVEEEKFHDSYYKYRDLYDGGAVNGVGYWDLVSKALDRNLDYKTLEYLAKFDLDSWYNQNQDMWSLVKKLKENYKTALLSNNLHELVIRMEKDLDLNKHFDVITFSYKLGIVKPDPRIYEHCLKDLNLEPQETIFIDDRKNNIQTANNLGINGIIFENYSQLLNDLKRFDLFF
ncbi:MAG: HAD family phosphatase [Candidatus Sericytochromatia bacterium]